MVRGFVVKGTDPAPYRPGRGGRPGDFRLGTAAFSYCICEECCAAMPWRIALKAERIAKLRKLKRAGT